MKQFNFETDIERRSPFTGNVFMVDRMTSDWAEHHPLNVDQLIEDVYQEFAGSEFEESREALRKVWMATLSMPVRGDKSVYPNNNGAHRPAAMKVWHVAGDYWRRGLRLGDTLPEHCPSCNINRLEDGSWIALFPKDLHLLDENPATEDDFHSPNDRLNENDLNKLDNLSSDSMSVCSDGQAVDVETTPAVSPTDEEPMAKAEQGATEQCAVTFLPIGATLQPEPIIEAEAHPVPAIEAEEPFVMQPEVPRMSSRERNAEQRRRRREQREAQQRSYEAQLEREAREAEEAAREEERKKIYAAVGAAAVTLVLIYFFGLLGPAVFGLLAGGLLKG